MNIMISQEEYELLKRAREKAERQVIEAIDLAETFRDLLRESIEQTGRAHERERKYNEIIQVYKGMLKGDYGAEGKSNEGSRVVERGTALGSGETTQV